jgi:hypothetical protein
VLPVISAFMSRGVPEGEPVVLDIAQLEALLSRTFGIGLDAGRGREPVALVRLRLARALLGAAEASAVAAEAIAAERGIPAADIAAAEGLALHAAAFRRDRPGHRAIRPRASLGLSPTVPEGQELFASLTPTR